jgi:fluoride ion exporter CrcB/FEX
VKPDVAKKIVFGDSEGAHPLLEEIESEELPRQWYEEHGGSEETLEISAIAGIVAGTVTFSVYLLTSSPLLSPMVAFVVAPILGIISTLVVFILGLAATRILSPGHGDLRHQALSQNPLCTTLQSLLNSLNGYEGHSVRMIHSATRKPHMVIYDPDYDTIADIALTIKSNVFEVLDSARYLLPYVLSEMKHKTLDKRFGRFVFSYIGLSLLAWIGYLIFNSLGPRGIDITLLLDSLLPSFIWIWVVNLIAVFSLAIAFYQVKKKGIDSEITKKHPQWKEALELLIDTDLVTSSTPLSFEKRLEYIQSH